MSFDTLAVQLGSFAGSVLAVLIAAWQGGRLKGSTHATDIRLERGNAAFESLRKVDMEQADALGVLRTQTQALESRIRSLEVELRKERNAKPAP